MRYLASNLLLFFGLVGGASAIEVQWPTSMDTTIIQGLEDYVQPVATGKIESGCFGMVREEGRRFHEGIDIRPYQVLSNGEPADYVFAAMSGKVAYVNNDTNGPYGRYIILVHDNAEIGLYSLYAHLAKIDSTLRVGDNVARGKAIAIMGHTSLPSSPIPVERAHLHFEVGLRLADSFNAWYKSRFNFKRDPNLHGLWNGQNLTGFDPWSPGQLENEIKLNAWVVCPFEREFAQMHGKELWKALLTKHRPDLRLTLESPPNPSLN
ncbi:MAG: hypothetical protein EBU50_03875 [Opitutae bacterium]|nr:hypothetical protein [Opitutae bacterium]